MKKLLFILLVLFLLFPFSLATRAQGLLYVEGGAHHVQGIAYDADAGKM